MQFRGQDGKIISTTQHNTTRGKKTAPQVRTSCSRTSGDVISGSSSAAPGSDALIGAKTALAAPHRRARKPGDFSCKIYWFTTQILMNVDYNRVDMAAEWV